jgi:hypothetical protein
MSHDDYATAKESFNRAETVHHMIKQHASLEGFDFDPIPITTIIDIANVTDSLNVDGKTSLNGGLLVKGNLNVLNRISGLNDFSMGDDRMAIFNGPVVIQPGGKSRLFVANDGKIGIGTMTPSSSVDLQGDMNISGNLNVKTINGSSSSSSTPYGQTNLSVSNQASGWPNGTTKLIDTTWADGTDTVNYYTPGSLTNKPAMTLKANGNNVIGGNLQVGGTLTSANVQVTNGFNAPRANSTLYGLTLDAGGINALAGKGTMLPIRASLDMGADDTTREVNAGKIAYGNEWDPSSFNFIGKGKPGEIRKIHMWDDVTVDNRMRVNNNLDANVIVNRGTDFLLGTSDGGADNKGGRGNFANGMNHGRAMVKYVRNNADGTKSPQLYINWANDFPAGVVINGPLTSAGDTEITGNLTVRGTINGSSSIGLVADNNRQIKPKDVAPTKLQYGFGTMNNNSGDVTYADTLHFNSWGDGSGGKQNVMMLDKTKIGMRVYQAPFQDQNPYQRYKDAVMTDTNSNDVTVGGSLKANALSSSTSVSLPNWKLQEDSNGGLCFNKNNTNVFCVNGQGKLYK